MEAIESNEAFSLIFIVTRKIFEVLLILSEIRLLPKFSWI